MSFESPILLHLLWVVPFQAILLYAYWKWRRRILARLGSRALEERLLLGFSPQRFWTKNLLFALATALLVVALANPQRLVRRQVPEQQSADILIALDISESMLAADMAPSRLELARRFIRDLVQKLESDRVGLIFFAGNAYAQAPLSTDYDALLMFVQQANPDFITDQGTNLSAAIDLANRLSDPAAQSGRALILITDGENHETDVLEKTRSVYAGGMVVHTIGVGTESGAVIPRPQGGVKTNDQGAAVRTRMDAGLLRRIASAGKGRSLLLSDGPDAAVQTLRTEIRQMQKNTLEARSYDEYQSLFQWLLLPALLLLTVEQLLWWRKGKRTVS